MQPSTGDSYTNIPRRSLDIEDYFDIVRRHKAWILGPAFAALVIAVVVAFLWPDTYVSSATIRVVPPQVPESFVPRNVNMEMSQRITSMYQTISTRENLTNIVNTFNLYPEERKKKPVADVVEEMKRDIKIGNIGTVSAANREISAFSISFKYENRLLAQAVTKDLVSRFLNENQRDRTNQSVLTTQFLKDQLETAKKELEAIENRLASFRQNFQGRLPDQVQGNQMQLGTLEQRIANLNNGLSRISQEKVLLESDLRNVKSQRASLIIAPDQVQQREKNAELAQVEREIRQIEANLATLRESYKDSYPDVRKYQALLSATVKRKERIEQEEATAEQKGNPQQSNSARTQNAMYEKESRQLDAVIERLEAQLKGKDLEAANHKRDIENTEKQIRLVQSRIEALPASEQQYSEVIRDREVARLKYENLNKMKSQSSISEELERRQQGETLEILDPASLPLTPTQPQRPMIIAAGAGMGLMLGLVLAGAREAKDTSLKNLKDVRAYTQMSILGSVPLLENDLVIRRRRRLSWLGWSTACLVGIMIMSGSVFYYYATKV
jgi:succinoglycan biosynthesis transport protein ExoP